MSIIKDLIQLYKERNTFKRDYRRLEFASLDYEALQHMVDEVATKNVSIEIHNGSNTIIIRNKTSDDVQYKSFMDKYKEKNQ